MNSFSIDRANAACGALFVAIGLFFGIQSLGLQIGTAFRMGPGYFPLMLAIILVGLGVIIVLQSIRKVGEPVGGWAWRGMFFILPSPVIFALTLRGLGFVPSIFLTTLFACFASSKMKIWVALVLSAVMTAFTTVVFIYGLGLPFRIIGPWLGGF